MAKNAAGKWDGGFLLPVEATNKCGVPFYDSKGSASFYDEMGVSRALTSLIRGEGWDVSIVNEEYIAFRPIEG